MKSHGLVRAVPTERSLESSTIAGSSETIGRNGIFVIIIFLAYIFYALRKKFRQVVDNKRGYDDFLN